MSRSRKRVPITTNCRIRSQEQDRTICHHAFRRRVNIVLHQVCIGDIPTLDAEDHITGKRFTYDNMCDWCGDGKNAQWDALLTDPVYRK